KAEIRATHFTVGRLSGEIYRRRPLVFGNACTSAGSIAADASRDWGIVHAFPQIITQAGAVAYVGTFARVNEGLAVEFAASFYQYLLGQGMPIAKALWQVKADYDAAGGADPSWLFYCLYGDPLTTFTV
ncbi:MAG: CHAT domain-containing protein, partial [Anaerolineales bacterium]